MKLTLLTRSPVSLIWTLAISLSLGTFYDAQAKIKLFPLQRTAAKLYAFGYPLVIMDYTRKAIQAQTSTTDNQFYHVRKIPAAKAVAVVLPTSDNLYSTAFLNLLEEPIILHIPSANQRFLMVQILDAYSNVFASPGSRSLEGREANFAIVGPNWNEKKHPLPPNTIKITSPTNLTWLIVRIHLKSELPSEYEVVNQLQNGFTLTPLSHWNEGISNPPAQDDRVKEPDPIIPPVKVDRLSGLQFFQELSQLMKNNPPPARDNPALLEFRNILGFEPGKPFNPPRSFDIQSARVQLALLSAPKLAKLFQLRLLYNFGNFANGWRLFLGLPPYPIGEYGTDYWTRSMVARYGLGANLPEDCVYGTIFLQGGEDYVLHFEKDQIPRVDAFWSITVYQNGFFVENPLRKYAIHGIDPVVKNKDGSFDIYVQSDPPPTINSPNWLPSPRSGRYSLLLRMYSPHSDILEDRWKMPPVLKTELPLEFLEGIPQ